MALSWLAMGCATALYARSISAGALRSEWSEAPPPASWWLEAAFVLGVVLQAVAAVIVALTQA